MPGYFDFNNFRPGAGFAGTGAAFQRRVNPWDTLVPEGNDLEITGGLGFGRRDNPQGGRIPEQYSPQNGFFLDPRVGFNPAMGSYNYNPRETGKFQFGAGQVNKRMNPIMGINAPALGNPKAGKGQTGGMAAGPFNPQQPGFTDRAGSMVGNIQGAVGTAAIPQTRSLAGGSGRGGDETPMPDFSVPALTPEQKYLQDLAMDNYLSQLDAYGTIANQGPYGEAGIGNILSQVEPMENKALANTRMNLNAARQAESIRTNRQMQSIGGLGQYSPARGTELLRGLTADSNARNLASTQAMTAEQNAIMTGQGARRADLVKSNMDQRQTGLLGAQSVLGQMQDSYTGGFRPQFENQMTMAGLGFEADRYNTEDAQAYGRGMQSRGFAHDERMAYVNAYYQQQLQNLAKQKNWADWLGLAITGGATIAGAIFGGPPGAAAGASAGSAATKGWD